MPAFSAAEPLLTERHQHAILDAEKFGELIFLAERFADDAEHGICDDIWKRGISIVGMGGYFGQRISGITNVPSPERDHGALPASHRRGQGLHGAVAPDADLDLAAGRSFPHEARQLRPAFHGLAVVFQHDVAFFDSGLGGGAVFA